jgi:hypothetical protein
VEVEVKNFPSLASFERNMRELVRLAAADGAAVIVGSQAYLYRDDLTDAERSTLWFALAQQSDGHCPSLASMRKGLDAFNAASRALAKNAGVVFADLEPLIPKTGKFFTDDVHYRPAACERIATELERAVVDALNRHGGVVNR